MERAVHSHSGRIDGKRDGKEGKVNCLIKEKDSSSFVSIWKSLLDFTLETENKIKI